jgi:hypothetical protein
LAVVPASTGRTPPVPENERDPPGPRTSSAPVLLI